MDKALDLVGLQAKPALPDMSAVDASALPRAARKITLRLHAGDVLNTDASGRSLALVTRIYRLKDPSPFLRAPYATLADPATGKTPPIDGVLDVREIVLTPGQKVEVVETLPAEATHLGIVGLFRAPNERRWHFAFDAADAARTGVTIGLHGCALSVSEGRPLEASIEVMRLAGVTCR